MKRLLIVGAGGFGREVLGWATDAEPFQSEWKAAGFLDANPAALDGFDVTFEILGDPGDFEPSSSDLYVCAIADPRIKQRAISGLIARGAQFASLIHPSVVVGANCHIGIGCVLCPRVVLTTHVTLGRFVTINLASTVGHDVEMGDWCTLSCHTDITGKVKFGEGVFTGSHASVLPGLTVGSRAVIGAGSVVTRNVAAGTTMFGVPASVIYTRSAT